MVSIIEGIKDMFSDHSEVWGIYSFYPEGKEQLVHPDDLKKNTMLPRWGTVYRCRDFNPRADHITLATDKITFRVKPSKLERVPAPELVWGDKIILKKKPGVTRTILDIQYHHQRKVICYIVSSPNRMKDFVYWFDDQLEKDEQKAL